MLRQMFELCLKVPVKHISVMLGLIPKRGRGKRRMGNAKRTQPPPNFAPSVANSILPTYQMFDLILNVPSSFSYVGNQYGLNQY